MSIFLKILVQTLSFLSAGNISVMSINAQNTNDTVDDPGKDDKAFSSNRIKTIYKAQKCM